MKPIVGECVDALGLRLRLASAETFAKKTRGGSFPLAWATEMVPKLLDAFLSDMVNDVATDVAAIEQRLDDAAPTPADGADDDTNN